jgi:chemotaxis protein methyltransferase CheR
MRDTEFDFIRQLVYEHSRISLSADKRELVSARLGKRLRAQQMTSMDEYCDLLRRDDSHDELSHLIDAISTNHTFFFRENAHFEFVRDRIVPEMLARRSEDGGGGFQAWSAASSSGEEPYSLAITLAEALGASRWPWQIHGTDISHRILAKARAAVYRTETVEKIAPALLKTYFQKGIGPQAGNYRVRPSLANNVIFQHMNLLEGEPQFHYKFHVIFCRNVMIYFDRPTQEELVRKLSRWLIPGGYLLVGHSESLTAIKHPLELVKPATYRRPLGSRS